MKRKYLSAVFAALALLAVGLTSAGAASAATLKEKEGSFFQAVYGAPACQNGFVENAKKEVEKPQPVGCGLGRNFGFGANLLFRASTGAGVGENLKIEIGGVVLTAKDSYIGATLTSNRSGVNNPLSAAIQFADLQFSEGTGVGAAPAFTDTFDRPWISEFCSPAAAAGKCKTDPLFETPVGSVKIEDVSFEVVIGGAINVIQGTVWGVWENGTLRPAPKSN